MVDPTQLGGLGGIGPIQPQKPGGADGAQPADPAEFQRLLADSIQEIEHLQARADEQIQGLVTGEVTNVSEAMVAVERANLAFRTMMEIRNKILTAYEEVSRMQI